MADETPHSPDPDATWASEQQDDDQDKTAKETQVYEYFEELDAKKSLIGQQFDRYQVVSKLGQGGMAEVYKIYDPALDHFYALKLIGSSARALESIGNQEIERFKREARVAAKLRHPNIVSVYHTGEVEGRFFLVMDLVEGVPLGEYITKNAPSIHERVEIIHKLAEALAYAHAQKVIHRDLKPSNIIVTSEKEPMVMDFGMAKVVNVDSKLTQMGQVVGTPSYMAPEQAQGRIQDIGPVTDVYGLGAIMYEILTGRAPFKAKTVMTTLMAVVRERLIPVQELNPDTPQKVCQICHKALEKNSKRRFSSMKNMALALAKYLQSKGEPEGELESTWVQDPEALTKDNLLQADLESVALPKLPIEESVSGDTKKIGKYQIKRELARGGMGVIYLAEDQKLKRTVAIKVLLSGAHASEDERRRFLREAQMAAKLDHRRIVAVHDIGVCAEGDYFVMDYFPGKDMDEIFEKQGEKLRQNLSLCCNLAEKMLEGLDYAHQRQVIHRDIKPANILVKGKELKITDFGLAREIDPEDRLTQAGTFLGTPVYTSPEQIQGLADEMDGRSDLYSVGVILYEMVTGAVPFRSNTFAEIAQKVVYEEPPRPSLLNRHIPKDLETIILKALEKDKEDRYFSSEEFRQDLIRFRKGEPILAVPPSPWRIAQRKLKKHRTAVISACISLVVIWGVTSYVQAGKDEALAKERQKTAQTQAQLEKEKLEQQQQRQKQWYTRVEEIQFAAENNKFESAASLLITLQKDFPQKTEEIGKLKETVEQHKKRYLAQLQEKIRQSLQQQDWENFKILLTQANKLSLPTDSQLQRWNKLAEKNAVSLEFIAKPLEASYTIYPIDSEKKIASQPQFSNNISQPVDLEIGKSYLVEVSHPGYLPLRKIVSFPLSEKVEPVHLENIELVAETEENRDMVMVPGGEISLGIYHSGVLRGRKLLKNKVYKIKPFLIDQTEVSNQQYKQYLTAAGRDHAGYWPIHWNEGQPRKDEKNRPVRYVSFQHAQEYAAFYGKTLPTSEQWELAARASDERKFPWGDFSLSKNPTGKKQVCLHSSKGRPEKCGEMTLDISPYGVRDLAGNVTEWVQGPTLRGAQLARGGSFLLSRDWLFRIDNIAAWSIYVKNHRQYLKQVGFRCAKSLSEKQER